MNSETFDYIIIGGGSAGAVLTNRLSQDGSTICLLESGPRDLNPLIHIPAGYIRNVYSKTLTWGFHSEPSDGTANRQISMPQGKVLGGSSSINGLNYTRGQKADFNHWGQLGNKGWYYDEVLPYFRRSENRIGSGDDKYRGRKGELPITDLDWHHPVTEAFIDGAEELGIPRNPDYNGQSQEGSGYFQRTIHKGLRVSAARAFLKPCKKRSNVDIRTTSHATSIILEGKRAIGVCYKRGGIRGVKKTVMARREVLVAAGTVNTPKLLQLSGIGPSELLSQIGIPLQHELQGVGSNFRDHYGVRMVSKVKNIKTINNLVQGIPLIREVFNWVRGRPSLLAVSPSLAHIFWKSIETLDNPDLMFVFSPASFREGVVGLLDKEPGMTCGVWQQRPESRGYVHASSSDPFAKPKVQPNYLSSKIDRQVLLSGMRLGRQLMQTKSLSNFFETEITPGKDVQTDDEFLDYARHNGSTVYHLIGTSKMGPSSDPNAVVSDELKIHGLDALRIIDASIMPSMPSGNTNAATLMIAEKASDMIREKIPLKI